jgi:8-amino-7-oxononanoate synthase
MNRVEKLLTHKLAERENAGNLRQLTLKRAPVDFYSNDYLGIATSGYPAEASGNFPESLMCGSTGSRLLSGNSRRSEELEQTIAVFHRAESALLFNSGYDANTGLIPCITDRHTTILYDELCHASILDGVRLSLSNKRYKFRHNSVEDLAGKLKKFHGCTVVVIVESVYSMDGDTAPLNDFAMLCNEFGAQLIVDEAHATGVFGEKGEGLVCAMGLEDQVFARVHTFGKALG